MTETLISLDETITQRIRRIPPWYTKIPIIGMQMAHTIFGYIFLTDREYREVMSDNISIEVYGVVMHEWNHVERQLGMGVLWWNLKYIFSRSFRLQEELGAIKIQMEILANNGKIYDIERKARQFASSSYLWLLPYQKAFSILKKQWEDAREKVGSV